MEILICSTAAGNGNPLPTRSHKLDAGVDVRSAKTLWIPPYSRRLVPIGFVYRWTPKVVERDDCRFIQTIEVVKRGSGPIGLEPQAVIFDAGFFPRLEDPLGVSLIVANLCPWFRRIKKGQKVGQLIVREVILADFAPMGIEILQGFKQPDSRGDGRLGSTGR